jgi:hypothetical protein
MAVIAGGAEALADTPRYARFLRRLRGVAIDFMLFTVALVVALQLAVALNSNDLARVIGFGFIAGFLLYEPLLVAFAGGTVGHYLSNLRVVDDRTNGNVSLAKAFARVVIKAVLGWYSFITMLAARRHQAVHDLLTRSTVQIRDPAKARPGDYASERVELLSPGMPPRWRRFLTGVLYGVALTVVLVLAAEGLLVARVLSRACLVDGYCSGGENLLMAAFGLVWLIGIAFCIGLGWRARLWGARRRTVGP